MTVKSLITSPVNGTRLPSGRHEVRRITWTGKGRVTRVEFSTDRDPTWRTTTLLGPKPPEAGGNGEPPGTPRRKARPSSAPRLNSNGQVQQERTPWNRSGYLWNGIDRVSCEVG